MQSLLLQVLEKLTERQSYLHSRLLALESESSALGLANWAASDEQLVALLSSLSAAPDTQQP